MMLSRPGGASTALVIAAAVLVSRPALALTVRDASVTQKKTGGRFRIAGRFENVTAAGAENVALQIDQLAFVLPITKLAGKHAVFKYRGSRGTPGLRRLRVNFRARRFLAVGAGLPLAGLANPLRVRLATDTGEDCGIVHLAAARRRTKLTLARGERTSGCAMFDAPRLTPANVLVDTPTDVRVEVDVAAGAAMPGEPGLVVLGADGRAAGAPRCTLHDDGTEGDLVAGDGTWSCTATFREAAPAAIPLVVRAEEGARIMSSPGTFLGVVAGLSDADLSTVAAGQSAARAAWAASLADLGDTMAARVRTIAALLAQPGVVGATLAGDGHSIAIRYASGIQGGLLLAPRFLPSGAATAIGPGGRLVRRPAALDPPGRAPEPRTAGLTRVGNADVLFFDPGFFPFTAAEDEAVALAPVFTASACPRFDATVRQGRQATLASLGDLTRYGTVIMTTHGFVDSRGDVSLLTADPFNLDNVQHWNGDAQRDLVLEPVVEPVGVGQVDGDAGPDPGLDAFIAVKPAYVTGLPGAFSNANVYLGACWSASNGTLASAFFGKGAAALSGYDNSVSTTYAASAATQLFGHMLLDFDAVGDAWDAVSPKEDPLRLGRRDLTIVPTPDPIRVGARFLLRGDRGLAYLDEVEIMPEASTIDPDDSVTLAADLPGAEDCDLVYSWANSGTVGHLVGGDTQDDAGSEVTYVAGDTGGGTDLVTVEIAARGSDPTPQKLGEASAAVTVRTTTTTTTTTTSTTTTTEPCDAYAFDDYQSGCGSVSFSPQTIHPGDTVTVSVSFGLGGACGGYVDVSMSHALLPVMVDGSPATASAGVAGLYNYLGYCCGYPSPAGGAVVRFTTGGAHSVQFTIDPSATPSCIHNNGGSVQGPWVVLGNGGWSSPRPFKITAP